MMLGDVVVFGLRMSVVDTQVGFSVTYLGHGQLRQY